MQQAPVCGRGRDCRQDIEIEIDRIEIAKSEKKAKYDMMSAPDTSVQEQVVVAVDGICTMCLGKQLASRAALPVHAMPCPQLRVPSQSNATLQWEQLAPVVPCLQA